jgi:hypothetical protein
MEPRLPTKDEVKEKLGLSDEDFDILTAMPSVEDVQKSEGTLEQVGSIFNAPTWLWKTLKGKLLAVIIMVIGAVALFDGAGEVGEHSGDVAVIAINHYEAFIASRPAPRRDEPIVYVAFTPQSYWSSPSVAESMNAPIYPYRSPLNAFFNMPTGTIVTTTSGSYFG